MNKLSHEVDEAHEALGEPGDVSAEFAPGEVPLFSIRGMRMFALTEHLKALSSLCWPLYWAATSLDRSPGHMAIALAFVGLFLTLWWWQFSRCSFELFADRIEILMWNKLLPKNKSILPLAAVKYARLRGATLRIFVRPGVTERMIYRVPFRRVLAEDFMDRFEMMCEETGEPFQFIEDGKVREARNVGAARSVSAGPNLPDAG